MREVEILPTSYLWTDYLPLGEVTLLVGKPGIGKSTLAVDLAAKLTRGQLDGDCKGEQRHVLYSITEDSESMFKARFVAAGGDVDYVHLVDVVHGEVGDGSPLLINVDLDAVRAEIEKWNPALFVLDALNSSLVGQLNDNSSVRPQLERLKALAHATSTTVLGVGHFKKATFGVDPVDAIGGAGAYSQVVRQALACAADEEEETMVLSLIKSNVRSVAGTPSLAFSAEEVQVKSDDGGTTKVGRLTWLGETSTSVRELLQRVPQGENKDRDKPLQWLQAYLDEHGGGAPSTEIKADGEAAGFSWDVLKRAKKRTKDTEYEIFSCKSSYHGGWIWRWPTEREGSAEGSEESGTDPPGSLPALGAPFDRARDNG
ncbi:AAA family ATPase [Amycolatopsis samaneae]|uniref:AAA family ATPase n=1 Tax=Amycolatopsis samaneae TaxID=664691 RepID=A0ABW5GTM3_9PSEU